LLSLASLRLPLVALIRGVIGKLDGYMLHLYLLPLFSLLALAWAMVNFSKVQAESYLLFQLREVSPHSLAIFAGTLLFGLLSAANIVFMIKAFNTFRSRFTAWYFLFTAFSFMLITIILLFNGWIGLRTWTM